MCVKGKLLGGDVKSDTSRLRTVLQDLSFTQAKQWVVKNDMRPSGRRLKIQGVDFSEDTREIIELYLKDEFAERFVSFQNVAVSSITVKGAALFLKD